MSQLFALGDQSTEASASHQSSSFSDKFKLCKGKDVGF